MTLLFHILVLLFLFVLQPVLGRLLVFVPSKIETDGACSAGEAQKLKDFLQTSAGVASTLSGDIDALRKVGENAEKVDVLQNFLKGVPPSELPTVAKEVAAFLKSPVSLIRTFSTGPQDVLFTCTPTAQATPFKVVHGPKNKGPIIQISLSLFSVNTLNDIAHDVTQYKRLGSTPSPQSIQLPRSFALVGVVLWTNDSCSHGIQRFFGEALTLPQLAGKKTFLRDISTGLSPAKILALPVSKRLQKPELWMALAIISLADPKRFKVGQAIPTNKPTKQFHRPTNKQTKPPPPLPIQAKPLPLLPHEAATHKATTHKASGPVKQTTTHPPSAPLVRRPAIGKAAGKARIK